VRARKKIERGSKLLGMETRGFSQNGRTSGPKDKGSQKIEKNGWLEWGGMSRTRLKFQDGKRVQLRKGWKEKHQRKEARKRRKEQTQGKGGHQNPKTGLKGV